MIENFNLAYILWGILGGLAILGTFFATIWITKKSKDKS